MIPRLLAAGSFIKWHKAATTANFDVFFTCFDGEAYYIGTDENEKWTT